MTEPDPPRRREVLGLARLAAPAALLVVTGLVVAWQAARGWPYTHEGLRYPILSEHFTEAMHTGQLWPRWLPEINGGYGYPTFVYYPPLVFFLASALRLLTGDVLLALWGVCFVALGAGAVGAYALGAHGGRRTLGLLAGLVYLVTPYVWVNLLVRGDLCELLAMGLVPWALFGLRLVGERGRGGGRIGAPLVGLALVGALVILAHPITALLLAPSLVVCALFVCGPIGARTGQPVGSAHWDLALLLRIGLAGIAAAALATPYWQPVIALRDAVQSQGAFHGFFAPERHTLSVLQLLHGRWGFRGSMADTTDDDMSFELGGLQLLVALGGVIVGRREPFVRGFWVALVLSLAVTTRSFGWFWRLPLLAQMQFPWRMLAVTSGLLVGLGAGLRGLRVFSAGGRVSAVAVVAILAIVVLAAAGRREMFDRRASVADAAAEIERGTHRAAHDLNPYAVRNEFLPRTARAPSTPRGDRGYFEAPAGVRITPHAGRIAADVEVTREIELTVNQLLFPGWRLTIAGVPASPADLTAGEDGRMHLRLRPGATVWQRVEAQYGGPPGIGLRWAGVLVGLLLLAWLYRRSPRGGPLRSPASTTGGA